jgi:thiamine biosynthesis lipoprotein
MQVRKDTLVNIVWLLLLIPALAVGAALLYSRRPGAAEKLAVYEKAGEPGSYETRFEAMGTRGRFQAVAPDAAGAQRMFKDALRQVQMLEALMSTYRPESEISRLNQLGAQRPVEVSKHTLAVLQKAVEVARLTNGAFDVAYAPLRTLWHRAEQEGRVPAPDAIRKTLEAVGWKKLAIEGNQVRFSVPGMEVDLGAIAKGYAVDLAAQTLQQDGATSGIVDIGGNLRLFGAPPRGGKWSVLVNPPPGATEQIVLGLPPCGVATSGDYERYFAVGGKRFSHIMDPRTGWPVADMPSVTVVAADATMADAIGTGVSVLGEKEGIALIETMPEVQCMVMVRQSDGSIHKSMTAGFHKLIDSITQVRAEGAAPSGQEREGEQ